MKCAIIRRRHHVNADDAARMEYCARIWNQRGHQASVETEGAFDPAGCDAVLMVGNLNWYRETLHKLSLFHKDKRPVSGIWHIEPLPPSRRSGLGSPWLSVREIGKILLRDSRITDVYSNSWRLERELRRKTVELVLVSTRGRQEYLSERGISAQWVPIGSLPAESADLGLERDIDVLFLGTMDVPRRKQLVNRIRATGIELKTAGDWGDPAYWGEARIALLNRTKILLNLGRTEGELSGLRFVLGMANRAMVVSEPVYRPEPFLPGQHFAMGGLDQIPQILRHYLEDSEARGQMVEAAHQFVTGQHTMQRAALKMLELFEQLAGQGKRGPSAAKTA